MGQLLACDYIAEDHIHTYIITYNMGSHNRSTALERLAIDNWGA